MNPYKHVPADILNFMRYFGYEHLPEPLQKRSMVFYAAAHEVLVQASAHYDAQGHVDWAEVMVGLRNLLVSKDNVVRAFLPR